MAKSDGSSYFRRSSLFWMVTVTLSMGYFTQRNDPEQSHSVYMISTEGSVGMKKKARQFYNNWDLPLSGPCFGRSNSPYDTLGPLGALTKYLVKEYHSFMNTGWWLAWALHLCEALVALKVCSDKGVDSPSARLLWFVQTFLFGFASLGLLLKYKAGGRSKRH